MVKTASEYLRVPEKEKETILDKATNGIIEIVKELWENNDFVVNADMKNKHSQGLGDGPLGVIFSADVANDKVNAIYKTLNSGLISPSEVSLKVAKLLKAEKAFKLGDAKVNDDFVQAYVKKASPNPMETAVLTIRFSLLLPEYKEEDHDEEDV